MNTTTDKARGICRFCGARVVDGRETSGYTGEGPDWMTDEHDPRGVGGDFGCDESPETTWDGVGSHAVTEEEANEAHDRAAKARPPEKELKEFEDRITGDLLAAVDPIISNADLKLLYYTRDRIARRIADRIRRWL